MSRKTRSRRQQHEEGSPPPEDIEVLDAQEEEPPQYATIPEPDTKEEEDPYEVLQRNFDAVNKQRAEAEELAREEALKRQSAERQRDELDGRVHRQAASELESHKALVQKEYTLSETEGRAIEQAYAAALENQDYAAAAKAQRALVRVEGRLKQLEEIYVSVEDRIKNAPKTEQRQVQRVDEFEEGLKQLPKPLQDWARDHEDDLRKRTDLALAAGNLAASKGLKVGSDEYLDFMDEQMGYALEDEAETPPPPEKVETQRRPAKRRVPLAAPVSSSSSGDASKVYLTADDKRWAKEAGLTEREYAKYKKDASNSAIAKNFSMQQNTRGSR